MEETNEKEPGRWTNKFPEIELPAHPGEQPTNAPELAKWNQTRKTFNDALFKMRRHHMAVALDTLELVKAPYTPEQQIAYILGVSYLNGELDSRVADADGLLSVFSMFS